MCPDRQLLSAYVDGEVPSPWRERIAEHAALCPSCAAAIESYLALDRSLAVSVSEIEAESASVARVRARLDGPWAALESRSDGLLRARPQLLSRARAPSSWWSRNMSLPLPAAVAAAALVLALGGATAYLAFSPKAQSPIRTAATVDIPTIPSQGSTMDDLLRYLETRDAQVTLTIQMPTGTTFEGSGSPVVMRVPRDVGSSP
ncbi:MAG: zf-HC2 domain-containing protein [Spirochaetaceae bacterium]|nr:zf-HC2 domain-containing protein [Spirochaetaceae bacterium]